MRAHALLASVAVLAATSASAYDVTISNAATSNGSIVSGEFKATGRNAVLNYLDLQNALATGDLKVETTGHGAQAGDITVARKLTWSANTLTLDAFHSIILKKKLTATGTSGLELTLNDGGSGGELAMSGGTHGSVSFDSTT